MLTGPKLQQDVLEILLQFRQRPVVLVADIKEMFSQVVLTEKDCKYHRLLWRDLDPTKPVDVYEAVLLTFGDRASPYLTQFVLHSHALDFKENYSATVVATVAQKWCSNRTEVLEEIPQEDQATGVELDGSELLSVKTLAVHLNASEDVFMFIVKEINLTFYTK